MLLFLLFSCLKKICISRSFVLILSSMENQLLFKTIQDAAFEVRLHLGPGYLETVYRRVLAIELRARGLSAREEAPLSVYYKGESVGEFRADILVEGCLILELKAVREITPAHEAQLVNYLVASGLDYGFLINYGAEKFRFMKKTRIYDRSTGEPGVPGNPH